MGFESVEDGGVIVLLHQYQLKMAESCKIFIVAGFSLQGAPFGKRFHIVGSNFRFIWSRFRNLIYGQTLLAKYPLGPVPLQIFMTASKTTRGMARLNMASDSEA